MSSGNPAQGSFDFTAGGAEGARGDSTTADEKARERIRADLDRNFVVEAAAGTGKTTSLVERLVSLIAEGIAEPSEIAAITFTKKAAGELRERFQNGLEREVSREEDPKRAENIAGALAELDQSYIGTIHSFCGRMLRERPVEAGVPPDFVELEENEAAALNSEVWTNWVQALYLRGDQALDDLDQTDLSINELRSLMLALCDETDLEFVRERRKRPDLRPAWERLIAVADGLAAQMPQTPPAKGWDGVQEILRSTSAFRRMAEPGDLEMVRLLKSFEISSPEKKINGTRWPGADAKAIRKTVAELCEEVVAPALREWREYCHPIALDIVIPAVERAKQVRVDLGQLSFQDLLTLARDLLREHPDVRRWFQRRYRFILVDEFQDTDPIQAEILFYLTGKGDDPSWRRLALRPGALFIVGDPKQSIYRFRRADIALYKEVKDLITGSGGEIVRLSRNFRSTRQLCSWTNERFAAILPAMETEHQASMVHVDAHRTDEGGFGGVFSLQSDYSSAGRVARSEAIRIAAWIRDAVDSGRTIVERGEERVLTWGDFMLLTRERTRLDVYASALEHARIPYEITGGRGFGSSEELRALSAFLRAVIDPDDEVSLVAFLRGPLAGVSDDELYRHRSSGGFWSYLVDVPEGSPEPILRAFEQLRTSRAEAVELPPASVVARVVERLGLAPWSLALEGGQTRSGNLYKAMTIARRMSARGSSLTAIVEELTRLIEEPNDLEELSLRGADEMVVRIMNLHQAKGLEAAIVFLVDPRDKSVRVPEKHIDRSSEPPRAYVTVTRRKQWATELLAQPAGWQEKEARERLFTEAEEARLLYVAATRAKQALVVSTSRSKSSGNKGPWVDLWSSRLPELPDPDEPGSPKEDRLIDLDVERRVRAIEDSNALIRRPTWEIRSPSDDGHGDRIIAGTIRGKGASWGRVLHRALEVIMKDDGVALAPLLRNLLRDEGRFESEVDEAVEWIERVRDTALWKRARGAESVLVEVPFGTVSRDAENREILLRGVVDLVFREKGRWVVVDYKSDNTDKRLEQLVATYSGQVETYTRIWNERTGEPSTGYLLFLDGSHEIEVASF